MPPSYDAVPYAEADKGCMRYTGQYRTVHSIADSFNGNLKMVLGID